MSHIYFILSSTSTGLSLIVEKASSILSLVNWIGRVIIFIKDTDGELAEEYMGDKIGSRHYFDKKNEFETILV